ncbi:hypothetical protein Tco_0081267 [Tanacetum coccineum]
MGSSVTNPFEQTLFGKENQWLCEVNKFLMDSISGLCNFEIEYVGVQSDVNLDGGLVVCNQLVQECSGLDDKFINCAVKIGKKEEPEDDKVFGSCSSAVCSFEIGRSIDKDCWKLLVDDMEDETEIR